MTEQLKNILIGAALTLIINIIQSWVRKKLRLRTHWSVISGEIELCREKAAALLNPDKVIGSPLYRLPTSAYETSFPVLLENGALTGPQYLIVGRFFSLVQEINRGLEYSAEANQSNNHVHLFHEFQRIKLKARNLIEREGIDPSLHEKAKGLVNEKLSNWWKPSLLWF